MTALRGVNARSCEVRSGRAELKGRLAGMAPAEARAFVADLIEEPPRDLRSMRVRVLLEACPKLGPNTSRRYYEVGVVSPWHETLAELTVRERLALSGLLRLPGRLHPWTSV